MYRAKIENDLGEVLNFIEDKRFTITHIDGIDPPVAAISTGEMAMIDGTKFNNAKLNQRNIVFTIYINYDFENARRTLYRYFRIKKKTRFYYALETLSVYIDGYIESVEIDPYSEQQYAQISMICPDPLFKSTAEKVDNTANEAALFEFPFEVEAEGVAFSEYRSEHTVNLQNEGDSTTGVIIELRCTNRVLQPRIYNVLTFETIGLYVDMFEGDLIRINTERGQKSVKLIRDGVETNIINKLMENPTWLQIEPGDNVFMYTADEGAAYLQMTFKHTNQYLGV